MNTYELIEYRSASMAARHACASWLQNTQAPVMKRAGVGCVGLFEPCDETPSLWVLAVHGSMQACIQARVQMLQDPAWVGAPADASVPAEPLYEEAVVSLLQAFPSMPAPELPVAALGRRYQLRIYESPTVEAGQRKIRMFESGGEIDIFRRVGLDPVFFGMALAGPRLPNLTYMLSFKDQTAQRAAWGRFIEDPAWKALSGRPELKDAVIIRNITNIELAALPGSDI